MSCTVYQTNHKTGVVYAYDSVSYRDPITKKPKSKRTYLGRVDPITKLIIPKQSKDNPNRSKIADADAAETMPRELADLLELQRKEIEQLKKELTEYKNREEKAKEFIKNMEKELNSTFRLFEHNKKDPS